MPFEHLVADLAVKSFNILVVARNVLLQCVAAIECFRADVADEIAFIQVALFCGDLKVRKVSSRVDIWQLTLRWILRFARQENLEPQKSHLYFLMPVCVTVCCDNWPPRANALLQMTQILRNRIFVLNSVVLNVMWCLDTKLKFNLLTMAFLRCVLKAR